MIDSSNISTNSKSMSGIYNHRDYEALYAYLDVTLPCCLPVPVREKNTNFSLYDPNRYVKVLMFSVVLLSLVFSSHVVAQPDAQTELLKQQITFLNNANTETRLMYEATLSNLRWLLGALLGGGIITFFVALWELSRRVNTKVERLVTEKLDRSIKGRIETLEKIMRRENAVGFSQIAYVRPLEKDYHLPSAFYLLQDRGFSSVEFSESLAYVKEQDHVVVLDLENVDISDDRAVTKYLEEARHKLGDEQFCVVFVKGQSNAVRSMLRAWDHLGVANLPLTLISACVDAVHLTYSLQNKSGKPKTKS